MHGKEGGREEGEKALTFSPPFSVRLLYEPLFYLFGNFLPLFLVSPCTCGKIAPPPPPPPLLFTSEEEEEQQRLGSISGKEEEEEEGVLRAFSPFIYCEGRKVCEGVKRKRESPPPSSFFRPSLVINAAICYAYLISAEDKYHSTEKSPANGRQKIPQGQPTLL